MHQHREIACFSAQNVRMGLSPGYIGNRVRGEDGSKGDVTPSVNKLLLSRSCPAKMIEPVEEGMK